jgi:glucokinase
MDELEELDKKAMEQQYVASYHYSTFQKALGCFITIVILAVMIIAGSYLCVGIINLIVK